MANAARVTRVAYFEFNLVHQEIQPSFFTAFATLDWSATFYLLPSRMPGHRLSAFPQQAERLPLALSPAALLRLKRIAFRSLRVRNEHRPMTGWVPTGEMLRHDMYVLGTSEPKDRRREFLRAFAPTGRRLLIVEHNSVGGLPPPMLQVYPLAHTLIIGRDPSASMSEPVSASAPSASASASMWHAVAPHVGAAEKPRDAVRFCVVGSVSTQRRNYAGLLSALRKLADDGYAGFVVDLVGRFSHQQVRWLPRALGAQLDGQRLEAKAVALGVRQLIEVPEHEYGEAEVDSRLRRCTHLLPLVDNTFEHKYFNGSTTASVGHALGYLCIPVLHQRLAARHFISYGYEYTGGSPYPAMRRVLDAPDWSRYEAVAAARSAQIEHNVRLLATLFRSTAPLETSSSVL